MNKVILVSLSAALISCGGSGSGDSTAATSNPCADPCAGDPCGSDPCGGNPSNAGPADLGVDWSGWQSWNKVNADAFVSKGHEKPWVNVYVPAAQAETYAALAGEMPRGFAVVKSVHEDASGSAGDVAMLTVMAKMGSDYDPDNGNWYYGVLSADGKKAMNEGKIEMCINCHSTGKDYLFGAK